MVISPIKLLAVSSHPTHVLRILFYNKLQLKLETRDAQSWITILEVMLFWQKAKISTKHLKDCVSKLEKIVWRMAGIVSYSKKICYTWHFAIMFYKLYWRQFLLAKWVQQLAFNQIFLRIFKLNGIKLTKRNIKLIFMKIKISILK